ncbi:MAG: hypothetical protein FJ263_11575, partial [Planctomycetes bacterium]|nr:hypothetical protein [Planctomycetota bacterium]
MKARFIILLVVAIFVPILAHSQNDGRFRQDNSLPAVREQGLDSNIPESDIGLFVPHISEGDLFTEESEVLVESEDKKEFAPTDFVAQGDNDVFVGSKKGQKYHVDEDGQFEPAMSEEDKSNWRHGKIHPQLIEQASKQEKLKIIIHLKAKP